MVFYLTYKGTIKNIPLQNSNAKVKKIHQLRISFHHQLKILWKDKPLKYYEEFTKHDRNYVYYKKLNIKNDQNPTALDCGDFSKPPLTMVKTIEINTNDFKFIPLVTNFFLLRAELDITFLSPLFPDDINKGDIDNKVKTLLDSLICPINTDQLPLQYKQTKCPNPLYCLLEDDGLIKKYSVSQEKLLHNNNNKVLIVIKVNIIPDYLTLGEHGNSNVGFGN